MSREVLILRKAAESLYIGLSYFTTVSLIHEVPVSRGSSLEFHPLTNAAFLGQAENFKYFILRYMPRSHPHIAVFRVVYTIKILYSLEPASRPSTRTHDKLYSKDMIFE